MRLILYAELILGFLGQFFIVQLMTSVQARRQFWAFYAWMVFSVSVTVPLLLLFHFGSHQHYFAGYWSVQVIEDILQLAICFNVFSDACRRSMDRVLFGLALLAIAALIAYISMAVPVNSFTGALGLAVRLSRTVSLTLSFGFFATLITLQLARVRLKVRARGIIAGLGIFVGGELAYAALFGIFGMSSVWCLQISRLAYFTAVYVWITHLLRLDKPFVPSRELILKLFRRMRDLLGENARMELSDL